MFATRLSDGEYVTLKIVKAAAEELPLMTRLNLPEERAKRANHSVPLLDVLTMPEDDTVVIIVIPLLYEMWSYPPWETRGEVLAAIQSILEVCDHFENPHSAYDHSLLGHCLSPRS